MRTHRRLINEPGVARYIAPAAGQVCQWLRHRRQHVCKEEVLELKSAEGSDEDVEECEQDAVSDFRVARQKGHSHEDDPGSDGDEVAVLVLVYEAQVVTVDHEHQCPADCQGARSSHQTHIRHCELRLGIQDNLPTDVELLKDVDSKAADPHAQKEAESHAEHWHRRHYDAVVKPQQQLKCPHHKDERYSQAKCNVKHFCGVVYTRPCGNEISSFRDVTSDVVCNDLVQPAAIGVKLKACVQSSSFRHLNDSVGELRHFPLRFE